jgi:hypothetical protein
MIIQKFYVTCVETTETTSSPLSKEILSRVDKGEEFKVSLDASSDRYLTKDSQNREVYVGYRDTNNVIHISDEFRLMGISQNSFKYVYENIDLMRML